MNQQGKKQVKEAVLIATLSTLAAGVINWTLDTVRARYESEMKKKKRKKRKAKGDE